MRRFAFPLIALAIGTAALSQHQTPAGYLAPGSVDLTKVLAPAPVEGDIRYETDRKVFRAMKAMVGSPRWQAATADVKYDTRSMMKDFSCATGIDLTPEATPLLYRLLGMASVDTGRANGTAKDTWKRLRPLWIDDGVTCESKESLGKSYDYPSGHTTKGWTLGLILAGLVPGRATPILTRARAYGESRIVCRVHNMSAVEAGRIGASAVMDAVEQTPAYQADFAAAKVELAHAKPVADSGTCAAEAALLGPSVLAGLKE
ncbi:acid phosphatase (class A) [Sphingomonas vulcanisoli]|uniref:Acid phosphatase n=1 Tax=Sphingomonas vulcanisoli TaxID=1658060 RepID=A0ABX0TU86_9SPHN|nr:phosphatase PAP2 family protein [Sphingomonas vulcanisoli]NIJ07151.1 acid phosphatase (class A) [Sphingomonas vulcanisoli]